MANPSSQSSATQERIYFNGGDYVKHKLPTSPLMLVVRPEKLRETSTGDSQLLGIRCQWFGHDGVLHEHRFNSKDLRHATAEERALSGIIPN